MDYVVVTYNDIDTIMDTLHSIKKQPNVNRIVVVASERCTDGTLEKIKDLYMNGLLIDMLLTENIGLAYARQLAIQEVDTEWFVFVDADVVLSDTWMEEMYPKLEYSIDLNASAIFGYLYRNKEQEIDLRDHSETREITGRMFTHNTIIRHDTVVDWVPDEGVNAYEDYLLTQDLIANGFKVFNVKVLSFHDHKGSAWKEATWGGAGAKISGYYTNILTPMKYLVGSIYGGLKRTVRQRKFSFIKIATIKGFGTLWGYLKWKQYIKK